MKVFIYNGGKKKLKMTSFETESDSKAERYEVRFQNTGELHSTSRSLEQALRYARALANWNHPTQVFDRQTQQFVFAATAYRKVS